jgi:hypothetical protein
METSILQIELNDGRIFKIFCANSTQKRKVMDHYYSIKNKVKKISQLVNGIHTANQFEQILKTI